MRRGQRRSDGSVRYVISKMKPEVITIIIGVALASGGYLAATQGSRGVLLAFLMLAVTVPFAFLRSGFDVDLTHKKIIVWRRVGPLPYSTETSKLIAPSIRRSREETTTETGATSRATVMRVHFGGVSLKASLDQETLDEIADEVKSLIESKEPKGKR